RGERLPQAFCARRNNGLAGSRRGFAFLVARWAHGDRRVGVPPAARPLVVGTVGTSGRLVPLCPSTFRGSACVCNLGLARDLSSALRGLVLGDHERWSGSCKGV